MKKHFSADALGGRFPYAVITKMIELIGLKHMDSKKLLKISGVDESNFDSVLRRFLIIEVRARLLDALLSLEYMTVTVAENSRDIIPGNNNSKCRGYFTRMVTDGL